MIDFTKQSSMANMSEKEAGNGWFRKQYEFESRVKNCECSINIIYYSTVVLIRKLSVVRL